MIPFLAKVRLRNTGKRTSISVSKTQRVKNKNAKMPMWCKSTRPIIFGQVVRQCGSAIAAQIANPEIFSASHTRSTYSPFSASKPIKLSKENPSPNKTLQKRCQRMKSLSPHPRAGMCELQLDNICCSQVLFAVTYPSKSVSKESIYHRKLLCFQSIL